MLRIKKHGMGDCRFQSIIMILTIIIFVGLFISTSAQLVVDSTAVERVSWSESCLWGRATYEVIFQQSDYTLGFLYGENRDGLTFIPAGWYNHNSNNKTVLFKTELANLPNAKLYVQAYVLPKSTVSKYEIGGATYRSNNKDWYYDIFQEPYLESDLPNRINGNVGEQITFTVYATGQALSYEWYRRTMSKDSTVFYYYDSLGVVTDSVYRYIYSWSEPAKINGQTSNEFTTPNLQAAWDGWKVYCRIYNTLGELFSRQTLLRVYE